MLVGAQSPEASEVPNVGSTLDKDEDSVAIFLCSIDRPCNVLTREGSAMLAREI